MITPKLVRVFCWVVGITAATMSVRGAEVAIEFTGMLKVGEEVQFALKKKSSGVSAWVTVGKQFDGYMVSRLDAATETLFVTKDGSEFQLRLNAARIEPSSTEPPPEIRTRILNNLRQLAAAADQFYLENGVGRTSYDDLVGPTKYIKQMVVVAGEDYRALEFSQGVPLKVRTGQGHEISHER